MTIEKTPEQPGEQPDAKPKVIRRPKPTTKEGWEMLKISTEIKKLRRDLKASKEGPGATEVFKDWLTTGTTIIGILAGLWGLWYGVISYADAKETEAAQAKEDQKFRFNEKMVAYVDDLDKNTNEARAVMFLMYFGKDAIPILLYKLERTDPNSSQAIISSILQIEREAGVGNIIRNKIYTNITNTFTYARKINMGTDDIDPLYNYLALAAAMKPPPPDSVMNAMKVQINNVQNDGTKRDLLDKYDLIKIE